MADTTNTTQAQQPTNATQAATGAPAAQQQGRMFTQDEVNQIVSDRLARERAKTAPAEPSAQDLREQELNAREAALACKEYIANQKLPAALLEIFPTSSEDAFKTAVQKLVKAFPIIAGKPSGMIVNTGTEHGVPIGGGIDAQIASAFARKD
ncbi:MAG: hypothetical protein IJ347_07090 [Faecalibacterium sp.]|nr:hypothetical protein [Faecalibacterium sp.]